MNRKHLNFWIDFGGRVGPPLFAATLVSSMLSNRFELKHQLLLAVSLLLIFLNHRIAYHRQA